MRQEQAAVEGWPVDEVVEAVQARLNVPQEEAREMVARLEELFEGKTEVEDKPLEKPDRALLWRLFCEGILTTETRVRPHPEHGRPWRYYHWQLVPVEHLSVQDRTEGAQAQAPPEIQVYADLPAGAWERHPVSAT